MLRTAGTPGFGGRQGSGRPPPNDLLRLMTSRAIESNAAALPSSRASGRSRTPCAISHLRLPRLLALRDTVLSALLAPPGHKKPTTALDSGLRLLPVRVASDSVLATSEGHTHPTHNARAHPVRAVARGGDEAGVPVQHRARPSFRSDVCYRR